MKILLTGRTGQVGWELARSLAEFGSVAATDRRVLDFSDSDAIRRTVRKERPEIIVNAAAYTAVDRAEQEPELAMRVNASSPAILAEEAKQLDALLVHYSSDYVFDGEKLSPYVESDLPNPINRYGQSKLEGERAIQQSGARYLILRTSWIYSSRGNNFFLAVIRLARERRRLRVVNDQTGSPTSARMLAVASVRAMHKVINDRSLEGLYHISAGGTTTWWAFARAILARLNLENEVEAISSDDYQAAARRPRNSVLDNSRLARQLSIRLPSWEVGLDEVAKTDRTGILGSD